MPKIWPHTFRWCLHQSIFMEIHKLCARGHGRVSGWCSCEIGSSSTGKPGVCVRATQWWNASVRAGRGLVAHRASARQNTPSSYTDTHTHTCTHTYIYTLKGWRSLVSHWKENSLFFNGTTTETSLLCHGFNDAVLIKVVLSLFNMHVQFYFETKLVMKNWFTNLFYFYFSMNKLYNLLTHRLSITVYFPPSIYSKK